MTTMTDSRAVNVLERLALGADEPDVHAALTHAIARLRESAEAQAQGGGEVCEVCDGGPGNDGPCLCGISAPPSAPVGVEGFGSRAVAEELLRCFESWDPGVRVLGNVQAKDAADLMRRILAQQPAARTVRLDLSVFDQPGDPRSNLIARGGTPPREQPAAVDDARRVMHELCDCPNGRAEHADWCAALAAQPGGSDNGR